MIIKSTRFTGSYTDYKKCPETSAPEYGFIGRSNVGKSSLINMLVNNKNLAKTSGKPGKTRTINHFFINDAWYLVDLPGYGYAGVSKEERKKWETFIHDYILNRENLMCLFVLIDARHDPQKNDLEFIKWLGISQIPFVLVFTKADKVSGSKLKKNIQAFKNQMLKDWEETPPVFVTSAVKNEGRDAVLDYIEAVNREF